MLTCLQVQVGPSMHGHTDPAPARRNALTARRMWQHLQTNH